MTLLKCGKLLRKSLYTGGALGGNGILETLIGSSLSLTQPGVLYKDYKESFYLFITSQMEQGQWGGTVRAETEVNSLRHWP